MIRLVKYVRVPFVVVALLALPMLPSLGLGGRSGTQVLSAQVRRPSMSRLVRRGLPANGSRNWGDTYYALEGRARRAVAQFDDAVVTSERNATGDIAVDITASTGQRVSRASLAAKAGAGGSLSVEGRGGRSTVPLKAGVKGTLDWAGTQSYLMSTEPDVLGRPSWRDNYLRRTGSVDDPDDRARRLSTDFGDGLVATTTRRGSDLASAKNKSTPYLTTVLTKDDEGVGTIQWHPGTQELVWHFPGLTKGKISADILDQAQAGWTFTPTMAWANVQALAFYEMHTKRKAEQVASATGCGGASPAGRLAGLIEFVSPTLHADTEGCDYLHWLDNSIFRPCCDAHDRCYAKNGCSAWSWLFPYASSWECNECNTNVAICFDIAAYCWGDPACECELQGGWFDPREAYCFEEPIALRVDARRAPFRLSAPEDGALFDSHGAGERQQLSWVIPRTGIGFLVLDRNGNGKIDDGTEWFGNNTRLHDGTKAAHGFAALRDLDGGDASDGAVTPADPWYWDLRIWLDADRNGISAPSELMTLDAAGIVALSTTYEESDRIDRNGNVYPYTASVRYRTVSGDVVRPMYDVLLQHAD